MDEPEPLAPPPPVSEIYFIICAVTHDFKQCGILTSVDSDKPVQHPFKLRKLK